ncbi:glycosyltransferase [Nesterenkonia sp.]|uniref:glycosyltransferase family protein n=1 Tax=Nesterenkonia sp. TaxID=704201 RepID=UPI00260E5C9C|nr:glycosyltransferase [Nesterenkonia sp.]
MSITVAMYSHDSVGLGHARRNRALAHALAADLPRITGQRVRGLLIAGHPGATADTLPEGWDWLVLPGFTRTQDGYQCRSLDVSTERLWHLRSSTAAAALEAMSPDLLIVDRHAFGVDNELLPALETLRAVGTRCVLGMREVLDSPDVARREWARIGGPRAVSHYYDSLWIYGDRSIYDPVATGEIPPELAGRTRFTGYLSHGRPEDPLTRSSIRAEQPYLLTMVGGGSDGGPIGLAAAQATLPEGHQHLILTGPQMPAADHDRILDAVRSSGAERGRIRVTRYAPHVPMLVRDAAAVVSMGGYNSLAEIMATTTPALIVPRSARRQEQPRRAAALAAAGAVETLPPEQLTAETLTSWYADAARRRTVRDSVDLDGLTRIGDFAADELPPDTPGAAAQFAAAAAEQNHERSIPHAR